MLTDQQLAEIEARDYAHITIPTAATCERWTCRVCGVVSPDLDAHWAHLTSDAHAAQLDARAGRTPRPRLEAR